MTQEDKERIEKAYQLERFKKQVSNMPDKSFIDMTIEYFGLMSGDIITGYELAKRLEKFYTDTFNQGKIEGFNEGIEAAIDVLLKTRFRSDIHPTKSFEEIEKPI